MISKIGVLIPSLNPDRKLLDLIVQLRGSFSSVLVVNDGSVIGTEIFDKIKELGCNVVCHPTNLGKGAALKTGFKWFLDNASEIKGIVTADSDGQHRPEDIAKVAERLLDVQTGIVLGVRSFTGKVPLRSMFGNLIIRWFFRILTGISVKDTQTGLRGIPVELVPRMLKISGDRYEYEMRMLADCKFHAIRPIEVDIETIYIEGNESSHFHPIRDSVKIISALIRDKYSRG